MALQSSGAISLKDIEDEFGGSGAIPISDYRRNEVLVKSGHAANADIPTTSSNIQFSDFHGALNVYETVGLAQGSTIYAQDARDSYTGPAVTSWIYFFVYSDGTDTFLSCYTLGQDASSYPSGSSNAGSYNGTTIYTVNLGGQYYCKATASNLNDDLQSNSTITITNNFESYTQITTGTEASSKHYRIKCYSDADTGSSTYAYARGLLTFDFNSAGGVNADLSINWNYSVASSSESNA